MFATAGITQTVYATVPWAAGTVTARLADPAGAAVGGELSTTQPATAEDPHVRGVELPVLEPGLHTLTWELDGEEFAEQLDVRAGRVAPTQMLASSLAKGALNGDPEWADWKRVMALGVALERLERECRVALIPARTTETVTGSCGWEVEVEEALPFRLVACSAPGVDVGAAIVDRYAGTIDLGASTAAPFTVTYDHGESRGPRPDVERALVLLASALLAPGAANDRGFAISMEEGMVRVMTEGVGSTRFSIPYVQAVYMNHRQF